MVEVCFGGGGLGRALIPLCWVGKFYLGRVGDERLGLINWFLFEERIFFLIFLSPS